MVLYLKNPIWSPRKLLDLMNSYNKIAEYKNQYFKKTDSTYTKNILSEKEIRKTYHSKFLSD